MRRPKIKLPLKLIITIISFIGVFFIIGHLARILRNSDYFKIKDIVAQETNLVDLSYLKGRNIFNVNLKKESSYISELYPTYKKIVFIKILPNRLFIDFIRRKPLAYIKLYRYFCVDEDLVLFDVSSQLEESDLPIILGLETKIFAPKLGRKYSLRELLLALDIINEVKTNRALKDCKVKRIDVSNPSSASFFTQDDLEIKLGEDDIEDRINILSSLFTQVRSDWGNIKYIDLRFKEPVIKFKNAQ